MEGQATVHISASPDAVFALVSDVTRMGEWSPETIACEWIEGASGPAVGAKFKGTNKLGFYKWSTTPTITECVPGKVFAFDAGATEWRYTFAEADGGTSVTESFRTTETSGISRLYSLSIFGREKQVVKGMHKTLARLKQAAEASVA
jgi:uncharacterized protein YndB with AHSA1/START domain